MVETVLDIIDEVLVAVVVVGVACQVGRDAFQAKNYARIPKILQKPLPSILCDHWPKMWLPPDKEQQNQQNSKNHDVKCVKV